MSVHNPINVNPAAEIVSVMFDIARRVMSQQVHPDLGTVINAPNPLLIKLDIFAGESPFSGALVHEEDFIVAKNLNLETGDRVVVIPLAGGKFKWFVVASFQEENVPLSARVGHTLEKDFVGLEVSTNEDRTQRLPKMVANNWNDIRGEVNGVARALAHVLHTHSAVTNPGGEDDHTHVVITGVAINPE